MHAGQPPPDDAALIERSQRDPEAFAGLYDRHAALLHRYVARRLGDVAADDVVADTFHDAFRRRDKYDLTAADARPWLYGIATNLIGKHSRSEARMLRAYARTGTDPVLTRTGTPPRTEEYDQADSRLAAHPGGARRPAAHPGVIGRRPGAGQGRAGPGPVGLLQDRRLPEGRRRQCLRELGDLRRPKERLLRKRPPHRA
jgi:hypothetical protein